MSTFGFDEHIQYQLQVTYCVDLENPAPQDKVVQILEPYDGKNDADCMGVRSRVAVLLRLNQCRHQRGPYEITSLDRSVSTKKGIHNQTRGLGSARAQALAKVTNVSRRGRSLCQKKVGIASKYCFTSCLSMRMTPGMRMPI